MNAVNINMLVVAQSIVGYPVTPVSDPVDVTNKLRLHRFNGDCLHVLVDDAGGFKAIAHPHSASEKLIREGHLSEFTDAAPGSSDVPDPEIRVRLPGAPDEWVTWHISQNLTDRWGDFNYHNAAKKPLEPLEACPDLVARLREQMWDETCFIVRKDGRYGILFEVEYCSIESEGEAVAAVYAKDGCPLKPHADMIRIINDATLAKLARKFPGVEFAIPDESEVVDGRPALWAFVSDGLLNEDQREELGTIMLTL